MEAGVTDGGDADRSRCLTMQRDDKVEIIYYKLLSKSEQEIADILGIKQSGVNQHSTSVKWYCIEEALNYFEQLIFWKL